MKYFVGIIIILLVITIALLGASLVSINQIKGGGTGTFVLQSLNGVNSWAIPIGPTPWQSNIIPTGTPNGTLTTFTLPTTPTTSASIQLFRNGVLQQQSTTGDYTFSGTTITFLLGSIPQTGDLLIAFYY